VSIRLVFNPEMGGVGKAKSEQITYREMHILAMAAEGYSNKEIAENLGIKYQTVKNNLYRLTKKLGAKNTTHALLLAMDAGWISIDIVSDDMDEDLSPERREIARIRMQKEPKKVSKH
jgi:DNA-binding CsgD family transcriptional regulator